MMENVRNTTVYLCVFLKNICVFVQSIQDLQLWLVRSRKYL